MLSLLAVGAASLGSFYYSDKILKILAEPITRVVPQVYFFSPADAFVVKIKVSLLAGLLFASPVVCGEFWGFVSPALYPSEKKWIPLLALVTSGFFLLGVLFAFYEVIPAALGFFLNQQTDFLKPMVSLSEYVSFLSGMLLAFGAAFNLPVVLVGAVLAGVLSVKTLNAFHKHAIVLIFVAAAILTPTPDVASQLILAIPLLCLFELSIGAAWAVEFLKKRAAMRECGA